MSSTAHDPAGPSPIDDFSQCHAGILGHLTLLGDLPALLEPAARARRIAADALSFFRSAVYEHHAEEERGEAADQAAAADQGSTSVTTRPVTPAGTGRPSTVSSVGS